MITFLLYIVFYRDIVSNGIQCRTTLYVSFISLIDQSIIIDQMNIMEALAKSYIDLFTDT